MSLARWFGSRGRLELGIAYRSLPRLTRAWDCSIRVLALAIWTPALLSSFRPSVFSQAAFGSEPILLTDVPRLEYATAG